MKKVNKKKEKAIEKFGYIVDSYKIREEIKLLGDENLKIFSYWSRSLISCDYDLRHPNYIEYKYAWDNRDKEWLPEGKSYVDMDKYIGG